MTTPGPTPSSNSLPPAASLSSEATRDDQGSKPPLAGEHWFEMTATLSADRQECFASWMDAAIAAFEARNRDRLRRPAASAR